MRLRGAAAALAILALFAVSGAVGAGTGKNGPIVFSAGPADYMAQFAVADLRTGRTTFTEIAEQAENPTLSPAGRSVAYHQWVGEYPVNSRPEVFVQNMKKGSRHSVGRGCDPAWSPSGRQIAFVRVISDEFCNHAELAIVNRDGSGLRELLPGTVSRPSWSPDGNWIAFLCGSDLCVIRPDGADEHTVATAVGGSGSRFPYSWAPDSTRIAVVAAGELQIASVSGAARPLAENAYSPRWSPTGRWIAFERYPGSGIVVADVEDASQTVVGDGNEPTWIGDDRLAFTTSDGIRTVSHDGSSPRLVVRAPAYVWYRDLQHVGSGGALAFRRETVDYAANLYALDPDREIVRRLTAPTVRGANPAVSPDGRQVAFSRVRPEGNHVLAVVGITGGRVRTLTHNRYGWDFQPAWSPNGKRIVFVHWTSAYEGALFVVGARGGKPHLLWSGERPGHPAWSPDGQHIAIDGVPRSSSQSLGIRLVVPGREGSVEITHPVAVYGQADIAPSWSPDGTKLAFVRREYEVHGYSDRIFVLTLATGEEQPITARTDENTIFHPFAARWSPDGRSVALLTCVEPAWFFCSRSAVAMMSPDGTGRISVWDRPKRSALDVAWAPSPRR